MRVEEFSLDMMNVLPCTSLRFSKSYTSQEILLTFLSVLGCNVYYSDVTVWGTYILQMTLSMDLMVYLLHGGEQVPVQREKESKSSGGHI